MTENSNFLRVFDLLDYQNKKYPQISSLNYFVDGAWQPFSTQAIKENVDNLSCWLIEQGFQKGDCVALVPKMGSPTWMIIDFACQQLGMVVVPIHPTSSTEEMKFILDEVMAKLCIAADDALFNKIKQATSVEIYHLEENKKGFLNAVSRGGNHAALMNELSKRRNAVSENDLLTIMYTSGTSGTPKGIMLTHRNVVSNIKSILPLLPIFPGDRVLSFLPFSHIFERTSCYSYMAFGANIYFSQALEGIRQDFQTVRPLFCTCVPKTLERMYEILEEQREQKSAVKKMLVTWAMKVGEQFKSDRRKGFLFGLKLLAARILVLNKWKRALGGKMKCMVVGAAALRPEIGRLFSAAGVMTLSGYGMTEASPFITVNRPEPGMHNFGTVGLPIPGVEIKLDDVNENGEGEILVKGPNIMQGYFNRPEMNREVFTADGWLRTGDVGKMVNKRFLAITDRKKDIFKTSSGIYIAPQQLERHFTSSPFISQGLIVGFNKPFVSAILVPHWVLLRNWCEENGVHWTSPQFMVHNIKVIQKMQQEVDGLNAPLQNYQRVQKFILSETDWTVESGELTASFKMIRGRLMERHANEIEKIYL
jgi:long-chain acyl-CoA synthetase